MTDGLEPLLFPMMSDIAPGAELGLNDNDLFKFFLNDELSSEDTPGSSPPLHLGSPCSPQSDASTSPIEVYDTPLTSNSDELSFTPEYDNIFPQVKQEPVSPTTLVPESEPYFPPQRKRDRSIGKESAASLPQPVSTPVSSPPIASSDLLKQQVLASFNNSNRGSSTPDEERQLKRQRRLVKNRESAQLSRLRKKIYIEELEKKVNLLSTENETLKKQLALISADKAKLHDEVAYLQNLWKQQHPNSAITINTTNVNDRQRSPPLPASYTMPKNVKTAGVCLLLVLFSFGLLFNNNINNNSPFDLATSVKPHTGRALKSIADSESSSPSAASLAHASNSISNELVKLSPSKLVLSATDDQDEEDRLALQLVGNSNNQKQVLVVENPKNKKRASASNVEVIHTKKQKMKIADGKTSHPHDNDSGLVPVSVKGDQIRLQSNGEVAHKQDTSYIYCAEAQHITPVNTSISGETRFYNNQNRIGGFPENIALLIPSSLLNTSFTDSNHNSETHPGGILEVSCQVLNLHLWPAPSQQGNQNH